MFRVHLSTFFNSYDKYLMYTNLSVFEKILLWSNNDTQKTVTHQKRKLSKKR